MIYLRQGTATTLKLGPFLDDTDGKTAETGLTITQADVRLSKNGGDIAQKSDATSATHDELGVYNVPLNATDTNTAGVLQIFIHESGAIPVFESYMVVPSNVYDSLFLGTDNLYVDALQIESADASNLINGEVATALASYDAATGTEVASIASDVADILLDTGTNGVVISSATMQAIADEVLKRGVSNVEDAADANSIAAIVLATFFGEISGTNFNVYKTDGLTLFGTTTVETDINALPIVSVGV